MHKIIPYLKKADALPEYRLAVEFEDGVKGIIDLSRWKGKGVCSYWDDDKNFRLFELTADKKIKWNENIDMDPDAFYLKLINKTFSEYAGDQQLLGYPD
jgi:hypothetical protein